MSVFISYSRRNTDFVRRLHEALIAHGRETWVDWEGIPPTADWMDEIHAAIDAAEAVAFVLSPDSIKSTVCLQELEHALAQNKRLIPIVCLPVDPAETPPALARLNWVFCHDGNFDKGLQTLLSAVDTDLDWVKAHTRLLVRAVEWDRRARESSLALRGEDLKAAERWLTEGPTKSPPPTELQTRYIIESRRQASRRRTMLLSGAGVALIASAVLGTLFLLQRRESGRQEAVAVSRRLAAVAERVQDAPLEYSGDASRLQLSVQLAAEALRRVDAVGQRSVEADRVLRAAVARLPQRVAELAYDDKPEIAALAFQGGAEVVAASAKTLASQTWRLDGAQAVGGGKEAIEAKEVVLSPDGGTLAAIEPKHPDGAVAVRDARSLALKARIRDSAGAETVALAPGAAYALVTQQKWLADKHAYEPPVTTLWQLPSDGREAREVLKLPSISGPVFSPDGAWLAATGKDDEPLIWSVERLARGDPAPLRSLAEDAPLARRPLFSPDGRHLAMAYGENPELIGVWSVADWKRVYKLPVSDESYPLAVAPGGRHVATATSHGEATLVRVFDAMHGCEVAQTLAATTDPVVAFAATGRTMAVASEHRVEIFAFAAGCGDARQFDGVAGAVAAAFSADESHLGVVARSAEGLALQRVDVAGARVVLTRPLGAAAVMQFSGNGSVLALASGNRIRLVDVASGGERASATSTDGVAALALSRDGGHLAAATRGNVLQIWNGASLQAQASAPLPDPLEAGAGSLAIEPARVVAITRGEARRVGEPLTLQSWTLPAMAHAAAPVGRDRGGFAANVCGLSEGGGRVAINAGVSGIRVRETASGKDLAILDDPGRGRRCTFSADERYLAVAAGTSVRIWEVASQAEVANLAASGTVRALAFSPGGRYLAATLQDGALARWLLRPADLIAEACARLPGNISQEDWERYVGNVPYVELCPALGK